jgi:pilus assembly protein CpaC
MARPEFCHDLRPDRPHMTILSSAFTCSGRTGLALAALLCVAQPGRADTLDQSFVQMVDKVALIPPGPHDSEMLDKVAQAVGFIKAMDLPRAQLAVNEALQLDARNSTLHFLNGFVYHLQARQGDAQKTDLAIEGYQQALRLDPGNWIAQEFLGLAFMDLRQFDRAKAEFANVLQMTPGSRVSVFGLMVSSYLTGDPQTACAMADQLGKSPEAPTRSFVRSSVSVYASCGEFAKADAMRQALARTDGAGQDMARVDRRLAQWKDFYHQQGQGGDAAGAPLRPASFSTAAGEARPELLAQAFAMPNQPRATAVQAQVPAARAPATAASAAGPAPSAPVVAATDDGPRMLLVDVVLLQTQEVISSSKGINLLSALTLQLGSATAPGYSWSSSTTLASGVAKVVSTAITRAVSIPALSYSLNIANANNSVNEVLARPTLAAMEGQPSEFFSGTNLSAGVVSTSTQGGTTIVPLDKRFGVKLAVTPTFLAHGRVQLKVEAQRTSLDATAENTKVAYQVQIGETTANANVVMNIGETLVLSGLSEKSSASTRDGVPGLQDVPLVQYLFSNKKTNDIQTSVLILITPRNPVQVADTPAAPGDTLASRMKALRERFGFGATIPTNVEAVMNSLQSNDLFREFRQGDVTMERWDRMRSTGERLKEALDFLYY